MSCLKGVNIDFETAVEVFTVHACCPRFVEYLLQRAASKFEPSLIEKGAELVCARHPDHHRRCVGEGAKTSLALPQRLLRLLLRGYVRRDTKKPGAVGVPVVCAMSPCAYPAQSPIWQQHALLRRVLAL